jgi:fatty-acid desaturase
MPTKKLNSYFWNVFLPAHVLFVVSIIYFKSSLSFYSSAFILWLLISGYGIGVGFHRLLAHKAFKTYRSVEFIISYFGCLGIQGSPIYWVNVHRGYHHPDSDGLKDIHSPIHGKWWAYFLWTIQTDYKSIKFDFVHSLLKKKEQLFLHNNYFKVVWLTWVVFLAVNPTLFFALIIAQIITLHQEFAVNLFCHTNGGYRNFNLPDHSVNRYFFGLFFWGVGFHNNHHARPQSISFAFSRYEFDPTVVLVKLIQKDRQ